MRVDSKSEKTVTLADGTRRNTTQTTYRRYATPSESDVTERTAERCTTHVDGDGTECSRQTRSAGRIRVTRHGSVHTDTDRTVTYELRPAAGGLSADVEGVSESRRQRSPGRPAGAGEEEEGAEGKGHCTQQAEGEASSGTDGERETAWREREV